MFGFLKTSPAAPLADVITRVSQGDITLIDVRDHSEVAGGKAAGAVHIPLMRMQDMADPRHPDCHPVFKSGKPIALYCASGARSGMAARILGQLGYDDVTNIGGLAHWAKAGGAFER